MAKKKRKRPNPSARTIQKKIYALEKKLRAKKLKSVKKAAKKGRRINPSGKLPVGKMVTVKAVRRADGKIDLYR